MSLITRSLVGLISCLPSPFQYVFLLLLFSFNQSSFAFLYISNTQMKHLCPEDPTAGAIIDPPHFPWSVYTYDLDDFARERPVRRNTNVMGYPFPKGTGQWVLFHPCSFSFLFLHLNTCSNNLSFKIQPTVQEHEELILLTRNLKLKLTEYS